jgi:hypothetical protein
MFIMADYEFINHGCFSPTGEPESSERLNAMSGPSVTAAKTGITNYDNADFSANAELSAESDEV